MAEQGAITPASDAEPDDHQAAGWSWKPVRDWAGPAACYAALVAIAWWGASIFANPPAASVTPSVAPAAKALITRATAPAESEDQVLRVVNPFDTAEVFAFPAGTTEAESREKVAALLLHRAHKRFNQWASLTPKANLRTARNL